MPEQLFVPKKIKVGFQERNDTYTEKLAYVIYYDLKDVLRKEKSWKSWCDDKIDPVEFDNVPTEGFVLNKKVGGYKSDWNYRSAHVRVYDPRDFEFEISVENLLFILSEVDCSRGKGLESKFAYAWSGTELVLLPCTSESYKNSIKYTELQNKGVKIKELVPGHTYQTKVQALLTFVGKLEKHCLPCDGVWQQPAVSIMYVFWDEAQEGFVFLKDAKTLATIHSDVVVPNFAELADKYGKSIHGSKAVSFFTKPMGKSAHWVSPEEDGFRIFETSYDWQDKSKVNTIRSRYVAKMKDGLPFFSASDKTAYAPWLKDRNGGHYGGYTSEIPFVEPTGLRLWVNLESGSKYEVRADYWGPNLIDQNEKEEDEDGE